jgi:hypothetical protein
VTDLLELHPPRLFPLVRCIGEGGRTVRPTSLVQLQSAVTVGHVMPDVDVVLVDAYEVDRRQLVFLSHGDGSMKHGVCPAVTDSAV